MKILFLLFAVSFQIISATFSFLGHLAGEVGVKYS